VERLTAAYRALRTYYSYKPCVRGLIYFMVVFLCRPSLQSSSAARSSKELPSQNGQVSHSRASMFNASILHRAVNAIGSVAPHSWFNQLDPDRMVFPMFYMTLPLISRCDFRSILILLQYIFLISEHLKNLHVVADS
jgi:hypothetical protein